MQISYETLNDAVTPFTQILGIEETYKQLSRRESLKPAGRAEAEAFRQKHWAALCIFELWKRIRVGSRPSGLFSNAQLLAVIGFMQSVREIYSQANLDARRKIQGALKDGIAENGLGPFMFEIEIWEHLRRGGAQVELHDLEGGGGMEFVARKGGNEVDVECKYVTTEAGQPIFRSKFAKFADIATPALSRAAEERSVFIHLELKGKFPVNDQQIKGIAENVCGVLKGDPLQGAIDYTVSALPDADKLGLNGRLYEMDEAAQRNRVAAIVDAKISNNPSILFACSRYGAAILAVTSNYESRYKKRVLRTLKEASESQLSGKRPGVFFVALESVDRETILSFYSQRNDGGIKGFAAIGLEILSNPNRRHVAALAFCGEVHRVDADCTALAKRTIRGARSSYASRQIYLVANSKIPNLDAILNVVSLGNAPLHTV